MKLPFTSGFYQLPSTSISNQRCVNYFIHTSEVGTETQEQLLGFSGIETKVDTGFGATRGSVVFQGELYRLDGTHLVKIDQFYNVTDLSTSVTISGFGRVSMAENGESICIVNPYGNSYFYDPTNGLVQITDADFLDIESNYGRARTVTYLRGFFVFNTDQVLFQSSLATTNKGQNFNALEFNPANQFPDDIVSIVASQDCLYVFGTSSFEIFRVNASTTTGEFAFSPVSVQNNQRGLVGRFNLINADSAVYFIGGSEREKNAVWEIRGATPKKISTDAIDELIEGYTDGFALAWGERGQFFRSFTFNDTTIVFNARNNKWSEIQETDFTKGWRVKTINKVYGKLLASDNSGKCGELKESVFTWFGDTILDYITTMPFSNNQRGLAIQSLEALCQSGVGNTSSTNPTIAMSFSRDGVSFGNERYRELGAAGVRTKRQVWRMLGRCDESIVLRFSISEPCRKAIIGLEATFI